MKVDDEAQARTVGSNERTMYFKIQEILCTLLETATIRGVGLENVKKVNAARYIDIKNRQNISDDPSLDTSMLRWLNRG